MADINFGTGNNTPSGDTVRSALTKLQDKVNAKSGGGGGTPTYTPPVITISGAQSKNEGSGSVVAFVYTLTRTGDLTKTATVNWALTGALAANDLAGGQATSGQASFAIGASTATITINTQGDTVSEPDETFTLTLNNPFQATLGSPFSATGTLLNDDAAADTTAPVFQSAATINLAEGQALSHTLVTDDNCTFVRLLNNDASYFTLNSNQLTMAAKDFESPVDGGTNNTYVVQIQATNAVGLTTTQTITVNITNVAEGAGTVDPELATPTLTLVSVNANGSSPKFKIGLDVADYVVGDSVNLFRRDKAGTLIQTHSATLTEANVGAGQLDLDLDTVPAGTYRYSAEAVKAGGSKSATTAVLVVGPDDIEPQLSAVSSAKVNSTAGKVNFTTDTGEGSVRVFRRTTNTAPTQTEMDAAPATAISAAGAKEIAISGLPGGQIQYIWIQQTDLAGNKTPITAAGNFTTDPAAVLSMALVDTGVRGSEISNVHTYTNKNLGAPDPNRYIIVIDLRHNTNPTTCTVGGVNLPKLTDTDALGTAFGGLVPSGTSGDVVVTGNDYTDGSMIYVLRGVGVGAITIGELPFTFRGDPHEIPAVTPAGGITFAALFSGQTTDPVFGNGASMVANSFIDGLHYNSWLASRSTASNLPIGTSNWNGTNSGGISVSIAP